MKLINKISGSKFCIQYVCLLVLMMLTSAVYAEKKLVRSIDFTNQPEGDARPWFLDKGYEMELDADDIEMTFKNKQLNLKTNEAKAGIFGLELKPENYLEDITSIEIEWGVIKQPEGANWETGNNRVPIAFMFFFGTEEISSGLPFGINPSPYFLSPFIGLNEQPDKVYIGKLYQKGGRYICATVTKGSNIAIKSNIKIDPRYMKLFAKKDIPPITGIALQMNTKDTKGGAHAFIRKVHFYSGR